jgi:hypothetical protein
MDKARARAARGGALVKDTKLARDVGLTRVRDVELAKAKATGAVGAISLAQARAATACVPNVGTKFPTWPDSVVWM